MKRALWAIAAFVVLVAAVWGGFAWRHHATFGTIAGEDHTTLTVDRGDRFSLAIPDRGSSVGDSWSARVSPNGVLSAGPRVPRLDHRRRRFSAAPSRNRLAASRSAAVSTCIFVSSPEHRSFRAVEGS